MMDGLPPCQAPDLRAIPLVELARQAGSGEDVIHDTVARMIDGEESPSLVPATIFNSAI
jgi:hypothetical protein